jgi:hypothetical protein
VISGLRSSASRLRPRRTALIAFRLSEAAAATLTFDQVLTGRRSGKRCVKQTARNRRARKCLRYVSKGSIRVDGKAGANTVSFAGRVGRRRLAVGRYRLTVAATDAAGNKATPRTTTITLLRR